MHRTNYKLYFPFSIFYLLAILTYQLPNFTPTVTVNKDEATNLIIASGDTLQLSYVASGLSLGINLSGSTGQGAFWSIHRIS